METQLKKYLNTLMITSIGVISFSLWSAIKSVMYLVSSADMFHELAEEIVLEELPSEVVLKFFYFIVAFVLISEVLIRLFVCMSAIREAKGKKTGYGYVIVGIYLFVSSLILFIQNALTFYNATTSIFDTIISIVIEITSVYTLGELLFAAIMIKMLKRKNNRK